MQKFLRTLMLMALMIVPFASHAQVIVEIGESTSTTTQYTVPVNMYYNYSLTQQIFTADEIGVAGTINSIAFEYTNTSSFSMDSVRVYMKNVTKTEFATTTDMEAIASTDLVWEGTLSAADAGWVTLTLTTPFVYDGTSNLLVCCYDNQSGYPGSAFKFRTTTTGSAYRGIAYYSDSYIPSIDDVTTFSGSKTRYTYRNNIQLGITPSGNYCEKPSTFEVSSITSDGATFTWATTSASSYQFEYKTSADTVWTEVTLTGNTYTLTTLSENTEYDVRVKAICGADSESGYKSASFRTACAAIATLPYTMGFEASEILATTPNADALPFCWSRYASGTGSYTYYPYSYSSTSYAHSGSRVLYFYDGTSASYPDTMVAILPELDVVTYPMNANRLTFWGRVSTGTNVKNVQIGTMTDPTDMSTFALVETVAVSGTTHTLYSVPLTTASATAPYLAIMLVKSSSGYLCIDDVTLEEMPACLEVSGVAVDTATSNSMTLSWLANPSNTSATYSVYNMADTSLVMDNITATTYTVTGLNVGTQYTFAVQANCPAGDAGMMSVTGYTACGPVALPFSEDFSVTLNTHPCWRGATGTTADQVLAGTALTLTANSQWTYSSSESNGIAAGHYRVNIYGTSCKKWMITPEIDLSTASNAQLSFDAVFTAYSGTGAATGFESNTSQKFMVLVSTNNGATWATAADISLANIAGTAYSTQVVNMTPYVGDTVRIAFYAQSTTSGGDNNLHIDNILVQETAGETCYPVTGLAASNITSSGVTLSWNGTAAGNYSVYDMSDPSVAMFTVTDTTVSPAALAPNTQYTFGVVANCTSGSSDTVTVTIRTACDAVVIPFTEGFEATSATVGCWTTDGPGNWTIGTGDYSSSTGAFEGSLNAKITHGTTGDATKLISPVLDLGTADGLQLTFAHIQRSWAGDIDELRVYTRASATAAWDTVAEYTDAVATWTVETLNLTGTIYQVAFEMTDSYGYGVGIDSVVFNLPPACMPVTDLTVDSATATSVFLSWNGTATAYNIYSATGDVVATGVTTTNYEVTGLTALTAYTFGVTAVCGTTESPVTIVNAATACAGATCTITINGVDSYGDGWNDNTINIMQAGVVIGTFTLTTGSSATETFTVCSSAPVSFAWVLGSYPDEASFEILDGGNTSVYTCTSGANLTDGVVFYTLTDACPSCLPAANLTVDSADLTSITISWTGSAASYDVYNGATMVANVTTNTYTFTGLTAATGYTFGVQAICSATDTASMATIDAMTACADITTLPYAEGFENGLGCWTTVNGSADGMPWNVVDDASYAHSGTGAAVSFSYYSTSIHADAWLISPKFVLPTIAAGDTLTLGWWHKVHNMYPSELYDVMISTTTNDTAAFTTTLLAVSPDSVSDYVQKVVDLSAYAGQSVYIAFHHHDSYDQYYLFIDDITMSVGAAPAPVPDSMLVNVAVNDATLGTTVPAPGAHYFYEGDTVSVIAVPGTGNHLESWTISIVYAGYGTVADTTITTGTTDVFDLFGGWVVEHGHNAYTFNVTANFATGVDSMMVTVAVNDATMGTTIPAPGVHYFVDGEAASVVAVPNDGYHLEGWTIQCQVAGFGTVLDTTLNMAMPDVFDLFGGWIVEWGDAMYAWNVTANFAVGEAPVMHDSVTVITSVNDATMGTITPAPGTHYYVEGDTVEFNIQANPGYYVYALQYTATYPMFGVIESETLTDSAEIAEFIAEMTEEPLVVEAEMYGLTVSINVIFAAEGTAPNIYHVTVGYDVSRGTVTGADDYIEGSNVTLTAIAYNGYEFVAWVENGDTVGRQSVYTIDNIDADHHLTAVFGVSTQGIADVDMENVKIYSTENVIVVRGAEGKPVVLFDVNGRQLDREACAAERVEFRVNNSGVYLVKVANAAAKRVVVVR